MTHQSDGLPVGSRADPQAVPGREGESQAQSHAGTLFSGDRNRCLFTAGRGTAAETRAIGK